jgi:preprotein translocase subunit SecD
MIRENWRLVLLSFLLVLSAVGVFVPLGGGGVGVPGGNATDTTQGPTQLQFGLELSGGTRIRAPVVGMTAEDVDLSTSGSAARDLETALASRLNVSLSDVRAAPATGTVEVFADADDGNVTRAEFADALRAEGYDVSESDIRAGVTDETLQQMERTLDNKINTGGLSGGDASIVTPADPSQERLIVVEVPNAGREEVLELIGSRGQVQIVAHFPVRENGTTTYRDVPLFDQDGITAVQSAQQGQGTEPPYVPITLTEEAARNFSNAMQRFGFTQQGVNACRYSVNESDAGYCLYTVRDDNVVFAASIAPGLAQIINNGEFVEQRSFRTTASNFSEAQRLQLDLQAGALPTNLDIDEGSTTFVAPALAQDFKLFSLITGFVAMLAVSGVVFVRYREPGVAAPMVLTAGAEVFILLGFAAAIGLALDLSHIAGFIAVIGTGVDDLIIIADEILQEGEVKTGRVFESRFRKAFWVIGAAAATTIVALSPLAVLSLGDLQGFAIVTIVGVLIGVLVTRPAYGNILRNLVLD